MSDILRIANCSGFYGDRLSAAREMVEGGPIDVLTGDYLAELTMAILYKSRAKKPETGFATTFVTQMEQVLGACLAKGIKVVANAGGLNPAGCAAAVQAVADKQGLKPKIAYVTGDDVLGKLDEWQRTGHALAHLIPEKAKLIEDTFWGMVGGRERFAEVAVSLRRSDQEDPESNESAQALLKITVKDPDGAKVGRAWSNRAIEMALANYPGFHMTSPPTEETAYAVYWPALVPSGMIEQVVHVGGREIAIPASMSGGPEMAPALPQSAVTPLTPGGRTVRIPLGRVAGARSGDKGGNANVGVWARTPDAYAWLRQFLTAERLSQLLPEARGLEVERYLLPNLLAVNFVIQRLLGEGVSASTRSDPQAKSLGEYLRARVVDVPEALLG